VTLDAVVLAASVLAAQRDSAQAGPLGLLVISLLAVAVWLLGRSMGRHLKRVPPAFPPPPAAPRGKGAPDGPPTGPADPTRPSR